jgi:hypothetical protein
MTWLESISSSIGVATGGASLAGAIYLASTSLEKEARPEARQQIAAFLKSTHVQYNVGHAAELVRHLFLMTFGARHLSFRCIRRSIAGTILFVTSVSLLMFLKHRADLNWPEYQPGTPTPLWAIVIYELPSLVVLAMIPDYLSLAKTRVILRWMVRKTRLHSVIALILLDIVLSYAISMIIYYSLILPVAGLNGVCATYRYFEGAVACGHMANPLRFVWVVITISSDMLWEALHPTHKYGPVNVLVFAFGISTVLTSIWTILVLAAVSLLRLAVGLNLALGAARWLFDVDEHPIKIIGLFVAGLVWIGSIAYAVI